MNNAKYFYVNQTGFDCFSIDCNRFGKWYNFNNLSNNKTSNIVNILLNSNYAFIED